MIAIRVNGAEHKVGAHADTPLLYILRNDLGLKGTRFGCGNGECGACYVIIEGRAVASCDTPLWSVAGKDILTIEGLGSEGGLHPLQQAFIDEQAAQCGYCASGIMMSAAALLANNPAPTDAEIRAALDKNLCRCGTHNRIVRAVQRAAVKQA
ncbi:MAG: (2Fe-2S)-binding protein [Betaproteobacteria bacterium RBG_16_64_18]|nr:MAG: (2Fe-2S)-binding protein [Betaproteobacteria bacterium RBG_16_64_18]OGA08215.1 MAG: (2Fe-2S)-binding protein [Betaproteobacteria bacterium RIFCSPLOWO2_02_FULL_65_20]OGB66104.1 MAG: (2Fe-2S)-binding protein [Burkholderiales bacterium RIFCSPLOWO2_12_FULL_64_99]